MTHDHDFQLDLDGQITCFICGTMDDERDISGSYNGRRAISEIDNVGPIPTPEAMLDKKTGYNTGKWSEDDDLGITPFLGPSR
jgi:hypothetical protein